MDGLKVARLAETKGYMWVALKDVSMVALWVV